jgi:hypothetical protein
MFFRLDKFEGRIAMNASLIQNLKFKQNEKINYITNYRININS